MKKKDQYYLVFLEGFITLGLQILSSVLIVPYWGSTFVFWTLQLFFAMLGLSVGYYVLPPRLNKRYKTKEEQLRKILLFSFFYAVIIFTFSENILLSLIKSISSPLAGTAISLIFFIFIPLSMLGSIPVLVISGGEKKESSEGKEAGEVFFISSVSGILSVVLFAFVTLPFWGLNYSLIMEALVFAAILLFFLKDQKKRTTLYFVAIGFLFAGFILLRKEKKVLWNDAASGLKVVEVQNGVLGQIKVAESRSTQTKYLYVNNALQSKTHVTGRSLFPYVYPLVMYSTCRPPKSSVLLAGLGGGSLVYEYDRLGYNVDVVDIDARLPGVIERNFLSPTKKLNYTESDIRRYIKLNKKKYDIIVFDLSKGESIPTNVYTLECFRECKKSLNKDGIILIHFLSSLTEDGLLALMSMKKTLKEAGYQCELLNYQKRKDIRDGVADLEKPEGYLLMAAEKIDLSSANFNIDSSLIKELIPSKDHLFLSLDESAGYVLTDDKPLLDILQAGNALNMRRQSIRSFIEFNNHAK